jgi:hypothetical protein
MVRTFTGDEGVSTCLAGLANVTRPGPGHDRHALHRFGARRQHPRYRAEQSLEGAGKVGARDLDCSHHADLQTFIIPKRLQVPKPQPPGEHPVVPHFRMAVKRKVGGVESEVASDQRAHSATVPVSERLEAAPKQPVVHDEETRSRGHGRVNRRLAGIHGSRQAMESARVGNLESVKGPAVVWDDPSTEIGV